MRIGYFADGPWGHNALEKLLADKSIEIAFIVPRNDTKDEFLKNKEQCLEQFKKFINHDRNKREIL